MRRLGYSLRLGATVARRCCNSTWDDWRSGGGGEEAADDEVAEAEEEAATATAAAVKEATATAAETQQEEARRRGSSRPRSYERHADGGEGLGLHVGASALVVASNFLSGFNGMQQRAAQLAAALGKLGYALHYVATGPLNATSDCARAQVWNAAATVALDVLSSIAPRPLP